MNNHVSNTGAEQILLDVDGLTKHFPIRKHLTRRLLRTVKAVQDVSFQVAKGQSVGLVGESGSGKTTVGRCILRAIEPTAGKVYLRDGEKMVDVGALGRKELRDFRRHMQMVFQDPYASLNPRMTIMRIVAEPLIVHGITSGTELRERVTDLLDKVGLDAKFLNRYPHAFSGGQRQRVGIARSLALNPKLIVADEPVSALDVSMQGQTLNLMKDLQETFDLTYLFISHDLSVIRQFCDRVLIMYAGRLVEVTETLKLFDQPRHPYTEALLSAIPKANPQDKSKRILLGGEVPDPAKLPDGCAFHPRCRYTKDICRTELPLLREIDTDHRSACHFAETLQLSAVRAAT